ncbi:MAG: replication factor C small subunit [Methanomethylophilus sp.]|nr:replication factor C small subunit [Methanomethylophilus sp.]MEE3478298.1 replication factor C small subunit [Methanomethylophilus sp.]
MNEIWTEKYRPKTLDEVVGQKSITDRLKGYVEAKNMSHLMFAGSPGTGKTTCALALARSMYGDSWRGNFIELNASDDRGIDVVRGKIKDFARTAPVDGAEFKIIFLDESDALTNDAQGALRRTMEKYSKTCRFILSCNYSSKIIDPIQSRCAVFRFRPLSNEDIREYLERICKEESLEVEEGALDALVYISRGDMRRAVNTLQTADSLGVPISVDVISKVSGSANEDEIMGILTSALAGRFTEASSKLDKVMIDYGLSGQDIIRQMHSQIFKLSVDTESKVKLIDKTGEIEFRIIEGSNEKIQLEALLAYMVLIGEKN